MTDRMVALRFGSIEFDNIRKFAERMGYEKVSPFIRDSVNEVVNSGNVSQIAGKNHIKYDSLKDRFIWEVQTDMGKKVIVAEDINSEFLEQLKNEIELKLKEREQLMKKKDKESVSIPRRFL